MALRDENVSVGRNGDIVRLVEESRSGGLVPLARFAFGAQRQQNLALRTQLHDGVSTHVCGPKVAVLIDAQTVAAREQAFAESSNEFPVLVELRDCLRAPAQDEKMSFGIERHAGG